MEKKPKPQKAQFRCAFSLIELLTSLIIMSLLIGAFAPIITKKLKASDITVGSFSGKKEESSTETAARPPTKEDCQKVNALFIPKEMNDGINDICVTKYNVGDNGITISKSVETVPAGSNCTKGNESLCCWQGQTSPSGYCGTTGNGNTDYSGCYRTMCQWEAANLSCKEYSPKALGGKWRLPTYIEMSGWAKHLNNLQFNKGYDGLQLCDSAKNYGSVVCITHTNPGVSFAKLCPGSFDNACWPYHNWSLTETGTNTNMYWDKYLHEGIFDSYREYEPTNAQSARCVLDTVIENAKKEEDADDGFNYKEPKSQEDCDKYNALFIPKNMNGGKTGVCATKYNIGDIYTDPIVNVTQITGGTCASKYCCWQGKTTSNCDTAGGNGNSTYSGCNRTLCNWAASDISCNSYAPDDIKGLWRLPTEEELIGWSKNLSTITLNKGSAGLQLCNEGGINGGAVNCYSSTACTSAAGTGCIPIALWGQNGVSYITYKYIFQAVIARPRHEGTSARCVTDKIPK